MKRSIALNAATMVVPILVHYNINQRNVPDGTSETGETLPPINHSFINRGVCGIREGSRAVPSGHVLEHLDAISATTPIPGTLTMFDDYIYDRDIVKFKAFTINMWMEIGFDYSRSNFGQFINFNTDSDTRIVIRFNNINFRNRNTNVGGWIDENPYAQYDKGADGRSHSMFTVTCDGDNMVYFYNDILIGRGPARPENDVIRDARGEWLSGNHITTRLRVYPRAIEHVDVKNIYRSYFPPLHRPYMLRPYSLGLIPAEEYLDKFDQSMLFSAVPDLHVYPRLLFGPADFPAVRAKFEASATGREYLKMMQYYLANYNVDNLGSSYSAHILGFCIQITEDAPRDHPYGQILADFIYNKVKAKELKIRTLHDKGPGQKWESFTLTYERDGLAFGFDTAAYWMDSDRIRECEEIMILGVASRTTKYDSYVSDAENDITDSFYESVVMRRVSNQDVWDTCQLCTYKIMFHGIDGHNPNDIKFASRKFRYHARGILTESGNLVEPYGKSADQRLYLPSIALARLTGQKTEFDHPHLYNMTIARAMQCAPMGRFCNDHGTWASAEFREQMAMFNTVYSDPNPSSKWWSRVFNARIRTGDTDDQLVQQYDEHTNATSLLLDTVGTNHIAIRETRNAPLSVGNDGGFDNLYAIQGIPRLVAGDGEDFDFVIDVKYREHGTLMRVAGVRLIFSPEGMHWIGFTDYVNAPINTRIRVIVGREDGQLYAEIGENRIYCTSDTGHGDITIGNPKDPARSNQDILVGQIWPIRMSIGDVEAIWREPSITDTSLPIRWDFPGVQSLYMCKDHGLEHKDYPLTKEDIDDIPFDMTDPDTGLMISLAGKTPTSTSVMSWTMDGHGGHNGKMAGHYDVFGTGTMFIGTQNRFAKYAYSFNTYSIDGNYPPGLGISNGAAIGSAATRNMVCASYDLTPSYKYEKVIQKFETWGVSFTEKIEGIDVEYVYRSIVNIRVADERSVILVIDDLKMKNGDQEYEFAKLIQTPADITVGPWTGNTMTLSAARTRYLFRRNRYIFPLNEHALPSTNGRRCRITSLTSPPKVMTWTTQHRHKTYGQGVSNETFPESTGDFNFHIANQIKLTHRGSGHQHNVTAIFPYFDTENIPTMTHSGNVVNVNEFRVYLERDVSGRTICTLNDTDGGVQSTVY